MIKLPRFQAGKFLVPVPTVVTGFVLFSKMPLILMVFIKGIFEMKHKNSRIFQAIKLKHMGFTPTQISEELGVSRTTINHWLTKAKLKGVKWEDISENSAEEL
ncbi:terminase gpP N-terminus-related DNA-binding protein [Turicimonas muris]|uniref:terminase gpP N-terminus-related DNA-binding protein n=1 Tax=Turicimonas muris TaxID=1796652 RepID=UPI0023F0B70D|nr:helix-turn-helix domain-containing protein [Turicimonas muris]